MLQTRRNLTLVLSLALCVVVMVMSSPADMAQTRTNTHTQKVSHGKTDTTDDVFHEYKGVGLGMTAEDARKKLGTPTEKDDEQDFYIFSDAESAQVYYDKAKTVIALSVNFVGDGNTVPKPKAVLGTDVTAKPDGSMHQLIRFPKAGYWVSYSKSAGTSPIITITFKKIE